MVVPRTPFKRLIDAVDAALGRYGAVDPEAGVDERRVPQSQLDRWITNTSYYATRFGPELQDCLLPGAAERFREETGGDLSAVCDDLFRIVAEKTALRLGEIPCARLKEAFLEKWALPRIRKSSVRSRVDGRFRRFLGGERDIVKSLGAFFKTCGPYLDIRRCRALLRELRGEIDLYTRLTTDYAQDPLTAYRIMLPIWILKDASPLYGLSLWADPDREKRVAAMGDITRAVCEGFEDHREDFQLSVGMSRVDCDEFVHHMVGLASDPALVEYDGSEAYESLSVPELFVALYCRRGRDHRMTLSSSYRDIPDDFPSFAVERARLLWNLVACSLFGPSQIDSWRPSVTEISEVEPVDVLTLDPELVEGCGRVVFRQVVAEDEGGRASTPITFDVDLGSSRLSTKPEEEGLSKVLGRGYVETFRPVLQFSERERADYADVYERARAVRVVTPHQHVATGQPKDSAWHLGVFVGGSPRRLYLVDLGSQNGSYVIRTEGDGETHVYAFRGRRERSLEALRRPLGDIVEDGSHVHMTGCLEARRGDLIVLGTSQFEIL